MPRMGPLAFSLLSIAVVGCAAISDKQDVAKGKVVCAREVRTGSLIPVVNCETPMTEEERRRVLEDAATARSISPPTVTPTTSR